jgi:hypothetical protein
MCPVNSPSPLQSDLARQTVSLTSLAPHLLQAPTTIPTASNHLTTIAKHSFPLGPLTMAVPPPQQASRYTMATPPTHQPHSSMPPPPVPNFQSTLSYTPTNQGPQAAPQSQAQAPAAQADPLEQRVLDLLYPYRDECFTDEDNTSVTKERNALILCGIPFLSPLTLAELTSP